MSWKPKKVSAYGLFLETRTGVKAPKAFHHPMANQAKGQWDNMNQQQKEHYVKKAKQLNEKNHASCQPGMATNGKLLKDIRKEEQEKEEILSKMNKDIEETVRKAHKEGKIGDLTFFVIEFNITCKNTFVKSRANEIGLVEASFKTGIKRCLHAFPDPGMYMRGTLSEIHTLAFDTHNIPPEGFILNSERDQICKEIEEFVEEQKIVYCRTEDHEKVKNCLENLGVENVLVYHLEKLLFEVGNCEEEELPSIRTAEGILEKDEHMYTTADTSCQFHLILDTPHFCALSIAARRAFDVLQVCCSILGIGMIPGAHIPEEPKDPKPKWIKTKRIYSPKEMETAIEQAFVREDKNAFGAKTCRKNVKNGVSLSSVHSSASSVNWSDSLSESMSAVSFADAAGRAHGKN